VAEETQQPAPAEPAPKKGGGVKLLLVMVASLVLGTAAGAFGLGPVLGPKFAGGSANAGGSDEGGGHGESSGGHGEEAAPAFHTLDNLVVNPAGSQGTRFLVMSLAIRVSEQGSTEELLAHDPEIRDALLSLLSGKTVDQLANPAARDSLKQSLKATIESVVGKGKIATILLPQFVLQ
jgi:flagellar FliL protein